MMQHLPRHPHGARTAILNSGRVQPLTIACTPLHQFERVPRISTTHGDAGHLMSTELATLRGCLHRANVAVLHDLRARRFRAVSLL